VIAFEAIVLARRGQGTFKANVMRIERACRITGVTREEHLRASHCKPWRDSSNEERLDGEIGSRTIAAIAASGMTVGAASSASRTTGMSWCHPWPMPRLSSS